MVTIPVKQSVNLTCFSNSAPHWTKLHGEGITGESGNMFIYDELLIIRRPLSHHTGVYFCSGSHANGTVFNRTVLLYVGSKLRQHFIHLNYTTVSKTVNLV